MQVLTTKQLAEMMVHCYPYCPVLEPFLDSLAAELGMPGKEEVVAAAQTHPMTDEWKQFTQYAKLAASDIFHDYLPFRHGRALQDSLNLLSTNTDSQYAVL